GHLEVLDERAEEGEGAVEAAELPRARARLGERPERGSAAVPGGEEAAVLRPREDPRDRPQRAQIVLAARAARRPRADLEQRELVGRRERPEELDERRVLPDERAVGGVGPLRELGQRLAGPRRRARLRGGRERGEERRGQRGL